MSSDSPARPRLRLLHHMARSGGTVICRCLASMDGVVLLSEIHPRGRRMFDPLRQAHEWYGLLSAADVAGIRANPPDFVSAVELVARRCAETGRTLVIRDWSHLDYTGVPFVVPAYRSLLAEALANRFDLVRCSTVRHPVDQWLSLSAKPVFRDQLGPRRFLRGVRRFTDLAQTTGFERFEDFTEAPDPVLERLCAALELKFDPGYAARWSGYTNITGDVLPGRSGDAIRSLPRKPMAPEALERFRSMPGYDEIIAALGYPD